MEGEFILQLASSKPNNFFAGIFKSIKKIDKDSNGFVTIDELDEIFREWYPLEMEGKTLNRYLKKIYGSVSNRNLINYKQIKSEVLSKVKLPTESSSSNTDVKKSNKQKVEDDDDISMLKIEGMQPVVGFIEQSGVIGKPKKSL